MLSTLKDVLHKAKEGNYAVPAFNINNMEMAKAIFEAALAEKSPVIISTSEGALEYAGLNTLGGLVHGLAKNHPYPVVYHLDHGKHPKIVLEAIKSGYYTSVMFDGSSLPVAENLSLTKELTIEAHKHGVSIEAELGAIAGIEDFVSVEEKNAHLTNPQEAVKFVQETGIDALAIAIGTKHGAYKFSGAAQLDMVRLKEIRQMVHVPLVLHGASGVPIDMKNLCTKYGCKIDDAKGVSNEVIQEAISLGISKINIDTDLRIAFVAGMRQELTDNPEVIDPRLILGAGSKLITQVARAKMSLFGSSNKAQ